MTFQSQTTHHLSSSSLNIFLTTRGISSQIMAEGAITLVVDHLLKMAATEIVSLMGLTKELGNLPNEFRAIKNVLHDAESRQITEESVRSWLQKLKYVAYDLEDLLEEWRILEVDAVTTPAGCTPCFGADQVRNFSSPLISLMKHKIRHLKYQKRVDEIKMRLEQIAAEKNKYQFRDTPVREMRAGRRTDSWVDQPSVIGRDKDKKIFISILVGGEDQLLTCGGGKVPALCIMGMGGLGKTTLAKSIYNNEMVKERFGKHHMWVYVGEVFNREEIMKSMIESWGGVVNHNQPRRERVARMLANRRYLLVLDDVWNEDYLAWEPLQEVLNQGENGSRVVITTRNRSVAATVRAAYTHELKGLGDDECLSIFKKVVFEGESDQEYEHLMDIGAKIVRKCGGVPLAVKTIAGVIRGRQQTRREWEIIADNEMWDLTAGPEGILPALMLSYTELPPRLKNCFGYCSLFEKDEELTKDELIRLWASQGYVTVNDEQKDVEEVGEVCFGELLGRSMFQEPKIDEEGTIVSCKMHNLVHDLARWVTKDEYRFIESESDLKNNALRLVHARHCTMKKEAVWRGIDNLAGVGNLRTFIYSDHGFCDKPIGMVKKLQNVRVLILRNCTSHICFDFNHLRKLVHLRHLDLSDNRMEQLPASIEKLKELRYLHLSNSTDMTTLPEAIASLSNLRTLDFKGCRNLTRMPDEIPASLRHLDVEGCFKLMELPERVVSLPHLQVINLRGCSLVEELPEGIPAMASLRRLNIEGCWGLKKLPNGIGRRNDVVVILDAFPVAAAGRDAGGGGGGSNRSNIGELRGMNMHIPRGDFAIDNLEKVGSRDEAQTAELEQKTCLQSLFLSWRDTHTRTRDYYTSTTEKKSIVVAAGGVLEGLRPPPQLLTLKLYHYPGLTFPSWMGDGGAFRHLREVDLEHCENCTQLPPLGQLPSLGRLTIGELRGVERVGREFFGGPSPTFPCLRYLYFQNMRNWSEWVALSPISSDEEGSAESPIMPELGTLKFFNCPKLEAMPPIFTTSLREVAIGDGSRMLYHSSLQFLPLYNSIIISGQEGAKSIHDAQLKIVIHEEVTELPAGLLHHTALRRLVLYHHPQLRSLPVELAQLTGLQKLLIWDCPELSGRCRIGGELWPLIAHIPRIEIDWRDIRHVV